MPREGSSARAAVADFYAKLMDSLREVGVDLSIRAEPFGLPLTTPFAEDREHQSYDRDTVERYWEALQWTHRVFKEFAGWYSGKSSPVHLFWHSFDLALTRFSGRPAPPLEADPVTREAYSHEAISFGFWPGDDKVREATYYSYTAPEPEVLISKPLPANATWAHAGNGHLASLPYERVRADADPRARLLGFLQAAYEAGASAAGWEAGQLESNWCPSREQLDQLVLAR